MAAIGTFLYKTVTWRDVIVKHIHCKYRTASSNLAHKKALEGSFFFTVWYTVSNFRAHLNEIT